MYSIDHRLIQPAVFFLSCSFTLTKPLRPSLYLPVHFKTYKSADLALTLRRGQSHTAMLQPRGGVFSRQFFYIIGYNPSLLYGKPDLSAAGSIS